jgi:hypothetical protein
MLRRYIPACVASQPSFSPLQAKDGSLLVADETGLVVWRIAYGR